MERKKKNKNKGRSKGGAGADPSDAVTSAELHLEKVEESISKEPVGASCKQCDAFQLRLVALEEKMTAVQCSCEQELQGLKKEVLMLDSKVGDVQKNLEDLLHEQGRFQATVHEQSELQLLRASEIAAEVTLESGELQNGPAMEELEGRSLINEMEQNGLNADKGQCFVQDVHRSISATAHIEESKESDAGDSEKAKKGGGGNSSPKYLEQVAAFSTPLQVDLEKKAALNAGSAGVQRDRKEAGVPFSDAPLVGAPIRLISFMTRFVSGADLVRNNRDRH